MTSSLPTLSRVAAILTVAATLAAGVAHAVPINITLSLPLSESSTLVTDVRMKSVGNAGNGVVFEWLSDDVAYYNEIFSASLPTPVGDGSNGVTPFYSTNKSYAVLDGYDYAVLHYGVGPGGAPGSGGGLQIWYLDGTTGNFDFGSKGKGPNGKGGISFLRLYKGEDHNVPDGGTTVILLGLSLSALVAFRRKFVG